MDLVSNPPPQKKKSNYDLPEGTQPQESMMWKEEEVLKGRRTWWISLLGDPIMLQSIQYSILIKKTTLIAIKLEYPIGECMTFKK